MQYFCGMNEYNRELRFVPSLLVEFRKRFSDYVFWDINENMFRPKEAAKGENGEDLPNKGSLILDVTCAPRTSSNPKTSTC
jgi:hypothetical protein